ncbi:hypothetical protein WG66_002441 [Moniliophthora roreri]|nr:hypothetical protein WG66_002441 [Moniliophthora roreri]
MTMAQTRRSVTKCSTKFYNAPLATTPPKSPLTAEEERKIDQDISLTERLAKLGIGILGNPALTSHTIITCHHQQTAIQQLSDLHGQDETTDTKEQTADETKNNSTPESIEEDSPTNENFNSPNKETENLPAELINSSFFSAYKEEIMSEDGSLTPRSKLKEEKSQTQMMIEISTVVLEEMEKKKKDKGSKVAAPDPFEGDRKDTKRFLMEVEIYLRMHPTDYDMDEKKCLFMLSYLRGRETQSWKKTQSKKIFNHKSKDPELTFDKLKDEFKKHYLLADIQAEAQIWIKESKMTNRADNYVNNFRVMADESGYNDQALIHIFRKGLPNLLAAKILNQPQRRPADLEGWYKAAIQYDEQYKYHKAVQKPKRFRVVDDKKKKSRNSMHIPLSYNNKIGKVGTNALLDSRAGGLFMSLEKAAKLGLKPIQL